jgi:hypothetical protein
MALTNDALWFMQPFQIFSTLGAAVNFGTYHVRTGTLSTDLSIENQ